MLASPRVASQQPALYLPAATELAKPANVHLRLQYLVLVTAEGHQRRFALGAGLPDGSVSPLVNRRLPLTPAKAQQLLDGVPGLRREWLLDGVGEPFGGAAAPVFAAVPPKPSPVPKHADGSVRWLRTRVEEVRVMPALDPWDPSLPSRGGGPSERELPGTFMERVRVLKEKGCGMTAAQVADVLRILEHVF